VHALVQNFLEQSNSELPSPPKNWAEFVCLLGIDAEVKIDGLAHSLLV